MKIASFASLAAAIAIILTVGCHSTNAQGTAFTYQGFLTQNGQLVRAPHDLTFTLYNAVSNGAMMAPLVTLSSVPVANGLFNVTIDFGTSPFMDNCLQAGNLAARLAKVAGRVELFGRGLEFQLEQTFLRFLQRKLELIVAHFSQFFGFRHVSYQQLL